MFEKERKKASENPINSDAMETIIGSNTYFEGNITSAAALRVDGVLKGEVNSAGTVIVGQSGQIYGNINTKYLLIAGSVYGKVKVEDKVEFSSTGYLVGDIETKNLVISEGAVFDGVCKMKKRDEKVQEGIAEINNYEAAKVIECNL